MRALKVPHMYIFVPSVGQGPANYRVHAMFHYVSGSIRNGCVGTRGRHGVVLLAEAPFKYEQPNKARQLESSHNWRGLPGSVWRL